VVVLRCWASGLWRCVYIREGKTPRRKRGQDIQETRHSDSLVELYGLTGNVSRNASRCESTGGEGD